MNSLSYSMIGSTAPAQTHQVLANLKRTGMGPMGDMPANGGVSPITPIGTDGGDVTYPYFLINGRVPADPQIKDYRAGRRIRLRIINAGADTAFRVAVPDAVLTITHTDGFAVGPQQTNSVILGMGERVDVTITVGASVPVIAIPEGKPGHAQLNLRVNGAAPTTNIDNFVQTLRSTAVLNTAQLVACRMSGCHSAIQIGYSRSGSLARWMAITGRSTESSTTHRMTA